MSRYDDEDGIDAPADRAWQAAIREDAQQQPPCKRCGRPYYMTSAEDRARYDAQIFAALTLWYRTSPLERGLDDNVCVKLARASVYAEFLVGADQGCCRQCSHEVIQPDVPAPPAERGR